MRLSFQNIPLKRGAKLLTELACISPGIAFTKQANLGLGPWDGKANTSSVDVRGCCGY